VLAKRRRDHCNAAIDHDAVAIGYRSKPPLDLRIHVVPKIVPDVRIEKICERRAGFFICHDYGFDQLDDRDERRRCFPRQNQLFNARLPFFNSSTMFYTLGPARNGNQSLPVGLAAVDPLPPDAAMIKPAIERKNEKGEQQYAHGVSKLSDTSLAEAVLRNGVIFNEECVVGLCAPATYLAKSLDLLGTKTSTKRASNGW
jgi:hypothetical protein